MLLLLLFIKELLTQSNTKSDNSQNLWHENNIAQLQFNKEILRELSNFKGHLWEKLESKFSKIIKENRENEKELLRNLDQFMSALTDKVDKKLEKGFEKTNDTFTSIIARLAKIDEAQKNIDKLNTEVVSLQNVLTDSKTRGIFWEVQLQSILESVFWENNKKMYEMQYHFSMNNTNVDAVVKTTKWVICIDAKFPLIWYQKMHEPDHDEFQKKAAEKLFISSVKKQILSISSKYIISGTTLDQAFLFLPAEAIFAEINAYYPEIIEFGQKHNVSIVSPTTLMAMLSIVANAIRSLETQKHAQVIQTELIKLSSDFGRFEQRWNKFTKDFKSVGKDIDSIDVTNQKIISRFGWIERLELSDEK